MFLPHHNANVFSEIRDVPQPIIYPQILQIHPLIRSVPKCNIQLWVVLIHDIYHVRIVKKLICNPFVGCYQLLPMRQGGDAVDGHSLSIAMVQVEQYTSLGLHLITFLQRKLIKVNPLPITIFIDQPCKFTSTVKTSHGLLQRIMSSLVECFQIQK